MGLIFPRAAFSKSAIKTLASKWEQGSRSLGCSGTMFRRDGPRFPNGTGLVPEQNFIISVFISLFILVPLAALQNPRCLPCDLANFAFGTMVPEHLTSLSYSKQVLFRNIFSIFAKNHEVPGQFNSKGADVPVRFAPLLSSLPAFTNNLVPLGDPKVADDPFCHDPIELAGRLFATPIRA